MADAAARAGGSEALDALRRTLDKLRARIRWRIIHDYSQDDAPLGLPP